MTDLTPTQSLDPATVMGLACDLAALSPAERDQQADTFERLRQAVLEIAELPDGYVLRLPTAGDTLHLIADFISFERRCCPFFEFNLQVTPDAGPIWLRLTGRPEVKAILSGAFAPGDSHD
jgi:hypothetical protein